MNNIVYSWEFNPLEIIYNQDGMTNVIKTVHWQYIATMGDISKQIINSLELPAPHPASFTPFNSVTKEMVTDWVIDRIGGTGMVQVMQNQLSSSIALEMQPVTGIMLPPWV